MIGLLDTNVKAGEQTRSRTVLVAITSHHFREDQQDTVDVVS